MSTPTKETGDKQDTKEKTPLDPYDNGIFDFMTPEVAIELYQRIHTKGIPTLDWKFYGRRKPNEPDGNAPDENSSKEQETSGNDPNNTSSEQVNTEFDFDESLNDTQADSLQLKTRSEPGSERKANLSDIMCDILKETAGD